MAPEVVVSGLGPYDSYDLKVDSFSLGVTVFEM